MATSNNPILVTGATGQQGGAVARALIAKGQKIRVMTRHPEKAAALAKAGAEVGYAIDIPKLTQQFGIPLATFAEWAKTIEWGEGKPDNMTCRISFS